LTGDAQPGVEKKPKNAGPPPYAGQPRVDDKSWYEGQPTNGKTTKSKHEPTSQPVTGGPTGENIYP